MKLPIAPILSLFMFSSVADADDWICKSESSQLVDGALHACGIGEGKDENEARAKAFENARAEFLRVCGASDTCKGRQVSVEPKRTTCEMQAKGNRCYRMVVFSIGAALAPEVEKKVKNGITKVQRIELRDTQEAFSPFVYEAIAGLPKVIVGQSKADLLKNFGAPKSVSDMTGYGGPKRLMMFFNGSMCLYPNRACSVVLERNIVESYSDFKPEFTEDLK